MKYVKLVGKLLALMAIYYAFQIVGGIVIGIVAAVQGIMSPEGITNFMNNNLAFILIPSMIISLIIYYFMYKNNEKRFFERCNFKKIKASSAIFITLISLSMSAIIIGASEYVIKYFPSYSDTSDMIKSSMGNVIGIAAIVVLAPIFEEILFRGLILSEIKEKANIIVTVIVQGVLFGLYHMNPFQSIYASLLGVTLGFICVRVGSVIGSMIGHITFNLCGTFVFPILLVNTEKFSYIYIIIGAIVFIISTYFFYKNTKNEYRYGLEQEIV